MTLPPPPPPPPPAPFQVSTLGGGAGRLKPSTNAPSSGERLAGSAASGADVASCAKGRGQALPGYV